MISVKYISTNLLSDSSHKWICLNSSVTPIHRSFPVTFDSFVSFDVHASLAPKEREASPQVSFPALFKGRILLSFLPGTHQAHHATLLRCPLSVEKDLFVDTMNFLARASRVFPFPRSSRELDSVK